MPVTLLKKTDNAKTLNFTEQNSSKMENKALWELATYTSERGCKREHLLGKLGQHFTQYSNVKLLLPS